MLSAIFRVSTSISGPIVTTYLKLLHFKPEKGVLAPEALRPRVGSGHYELAMAQYNSYQEILVKTLNQKTT